MGKSFPICIAHESSQLIWCGVASVCACEVALKNVYVNTFCLRIYICTQEWDIIGFLVYFFFRCIYKEDEKK